ncbi:MAG: RusA family crossover junction endodeoxyribonuclease [Bacilli bacterium]|jgi:Holliday junction resolvase RusA-like endonuclease|nr:RusA family crossover junction endodeoxyribonuclease [Bacilli bacterium]
MANRTATFVVPGIPVAKQRPKASVIRGFAHVYTPKKTAAFESYVALAYANECPGEPQFSGPLMVTITARFPLNKSDYNSKGEPNKHGRMKLSGLEAHVKKPDCDNLAKSILDGLNGVAFADDSQVITLLVMKKYDESPRTSVTIRSLSRD